MRSECTRTRSPTTSSTIKDMSIVYKELINSTINKLNSLFTKSKQPNVSVKMNVQRISALYDTEG